MKFSIGSASAVALALLAAAAGAQEVQTYSYDAHGRLVSVVRSGGGTSQTTTYGLDHADNRSSRAVSAPSMALAAPDVDASTDAGASDQRANPSAEPVAASRIQEPDQ